MRNYRAPGSIDRLNEAAEIPSRLWNSGSGLKAELSTVDLRMGCLRNIDSLI